MKSEYTEFIRRVRSDAGVPKISILMQSDPTGLETDRVRIALRDALDRATATDMSEGAAEFLTDIGRQSRSPDFWRQHRAPGLAVYASEAVNAVLDLPREPTSHSGPGPVFRVIELFAAAQQPEYLVLTLSAGAARLFRLGGGSAAIVHVPDMPANLDEVARFADLEPSLQRHASSRGGDLVSHGQEGGSRQLDHLRDRYLRLIDSAINATSEFGSLPLVLAGVDEVVSAYRSLSTYPAIADHTIQGNHDRSSGWQLAALSDIGGAPMNPSRERDRTACMTPTRKIATDPDEVFRAAETGRVEAAFLPLDRTGHGHLLDEVALAVDRNGGRVWVEDDAPPEKVEALLRY